MLETLLQLHLPQLGTFIVQEEQIDLLCLTARWFLPLFTHEGLPLAVLMRMWDQILLSGRTFLFAFCLAVWEQNSSEVLRCVLP